MVITLYCHICLILSSNHFVLIKFSAANRGRGAARTDYQSNLELSDRAKKRRKLLREKAEGSSINVEESSQGTCSKSCVARKTYHRGFRYRAEGSALA